MYGDTSVIRGLAARMREQGAEVRREADVLVGQAEAVPWAGLAADSMRRLVRAQAGSLRACAVRHDEAAEALERHAREIDHLVALIAAVERRVTRLLDGARRGLGLVGSVASQVVPDAVDEWLDHFRPPPPGSSAWLDVVVPPIA